MGLRPLSLAALLVVLTASGASFADTKAECLDASAKAQQLKLDGKLRAARDAFLRCSRDECPAVVRQDCDTWLGEVTAGLPTVVVTARDDAGHDLFDVSVSVDGEAFAEHPDGKSRAVDPGERSFVFTRGEVQKTVRVAIRQGEKDRIVEAIFPVPKPTPGAEKPETKPEEKPAPPKPSGTQEGSGGTRKGVGIGLVSVGAIGVGTSIALFLAANGEVFDLRDTCGVSRTCTDDQLSSVTTLRTIGGIAMGVSAATLVAGAVVLLTSPSAPRTSQAGLRVFASPTPGGAAGGFVFRY